MTFNDDEPIPAKDPGNTLFGRRAVGTELFKKKEAVVEETMFKAVVKLTGAASGKTRPGADIVAVIDVSGSMAGEKLEKLKTAMYFVIRKLSSIDRLSIVTFASSSERKCPLRQITNESQQDLVKLVKDLVAVGNTNITAGLQMARQIIKDRRFTGDRTPGIMLMSDGKQNEGEEATLVQGDCIPVFTFGFGKDHDIDVLQTIATKNHGTYAVADVGNTVNSNLSSAFASCLAGLVTVAVVDVMVTIFPAKTPIGKNEIMPKILGVSAGSYVTTQNPDGSFTVSLGNLYIKEERRILITLLLPKVDKEISMRGLRVTYSYINDTKRRIDGRPDSFNIDRRNSSSEPENEEVIAEEKRIESTQKMKQARILADSNKLDEAQDTLVDAECILDDAGSDRPHPMIEMLKANVQQLKKYMATPEIYKAIGRAYALSSETSHDRQRCAARGDDDEEFGLMYATPRMDEYVKQAKEFEKDPSKPLPSVVDDEKTEEAADPIASIAGPLNLYLDMAIQALQSIKEILGTSI